MEKRTTLILILIGLIVLIVAVCLNRPEIPNVKKIQTLQTQVNGLGDYIDGKLVVGRKYTDERIAFIRKYLNESLDLLTGLEHTNHEDIVKLEKNILELKLLINEDAKDFQHRFEESAQFFVDIGELIERNNKAIMALEAKVKQLEAQKPEIIVKKYYCCPCK